LGKKATDAEILKRLKAVEVRLLQNDSYSDIVRFCTKKYKITSRQVDKYIRKIKDKWTEILDKDSEQNLSKAIVQREMLYNKIIKSKKLSHNKIKIALKILDSIAKIQGLMINKIDLKGEVKFDLSNLSDEELREAEKELGINDES
jgi:hypothetical protein